MSALLPVLQSWLVARAKRTLKRERPFMITVSGTVGKSTTKQAVAAILRADEAPIQVRVSAKTIITNWEFRHRFWLLAPGRSIRLGYASSLSIHSKRRSKPLR